MLDAIAQALRLNGAEREHLNHLTKPVRRGVRAAARTQRVRPALQQLLDAMADVPAYVIGRRTDIIAWNRLACALLGDFDAMPPEQRNLAWQIFQEPASRELYDNWEGKAADIVANLRLDAGRYPDDPRLASLVGELSLKSEEFRRLWAAHDVLDKGHGTKQLHHPVVGPLILSYEALRPHGDPDQVLLTYHAEPGSPSAESLRLLASWSAEPAGAAQHQADPEAQHRADRG
ncbi:transcriptional regulator [Kitasatospora sp. NPDC002227]|uniref:MmyB family transcriptional regulator n=1 Tax=Kitasatospora sp. NPDC002227 TaxID=3154773 RepID=UPI0033270793